MKRCKQNKIKVYVPKCLKSCQHNLNSISKVRKQNTLHIYSYIFDDFPTLNYEKAKIRHFNPIKICFWMGKIVLPNLRIFEISKHVVPKNSYEKHLHNYWYPIKQKIDGISIKIESFHYLVFTIRKHIIASKHNVYLCKKSKLLFKV